MLDLIKFFIGPINRRIRHMVMRGIVKLIDDGTKIQQLQVSLLAGEVRDNVEHFQPYGFTSHPHPDAEAVVIFPNGNSSHGLVIAVDDRRYRLTGLVQGEIALYDDQGTKIHLKRNGNVDVVASTKVTIDSPAVQITGDLTVDGDIDAGGDVTTLLGDVVAGVISLKTHTHPHGDPTTGPPT